MIFTAKGADLDTLQAIIRAFIVFSFTLAIFRLSKKRFLGKGTPFDVVMGIVLGSVISRCINGSAKLLPTMAISVLFLIYHWVLSYLVSRYQIFSKLFEGIPFQLIKDGVVDKDGMKRTHTRELDIIEAARQTAHVETIDEISQSFLENSGKISIIPK